MPSSSSQSSNSSESVSSSSSSSSSKSSLSSSSSSSSTKEKYCSPDNKCACKCGCQACQFHDSSTGIRYFNGEFQHSVTAFAVGGYGLPWGHTRYYSNQRYRGDTLVNEDLGQGTNWFVANWPYVTNRNDSGSIVAVSRGQEDPLFFSKSGSTYTPLYGGEDQYTLAPDSGNGVFRLTEPSGLVWEFKDYDAPSDRDGRFYRATLPGGQQITVTAYTGDDISEVERTYDDGTNDYTEQYQYLYASSRLSSATVRRKVDAGAWTNIRREAYTYYGVSDSNGNEGDLKTAIEQLPDGSGGWTDHETSYYRYYKDSAGGIGFQHGLKYVVGPEAFERIPGNPLTASDTTLNTYADHYLEYDSSQRVTKHRILGQQQTYTFAYTLRTGTLTDDYNKWRRKTIMTRPDGASVTVFTNHIGQVILHELKDSTGSQTWRDCFQYDSAARSTQHAHPSAVDTWSLDNTASDLVITLRPSAGLIELTEYAASTTATETTAGNAQGYESAQKIKQGNTGAAITLRELKYFKRTVSGQSVVPLARETVYRDTAAAQPIETNYSYTWFSGKLNYQEQVTTLPAVPTAQNGSNSSNTRTQRYDELGQLLWSRDERGFIAGQQYDSVKGTLVQTIADVDGTLLALPSGWSTPAGGGLHLVTNYQADDLGRITRTLGPLHAIDLAGTSTNLRSIHETLYLDDADEVRTAQGYVTLNPSTFLYDVVTLHNPISIVKHDDAGRGIEQIQAPRGSGATTSGVLDPADTFDQTDYVRWTRHTYNNKGQLTATFVYHDIPASGEGDNGPHYRRTLFTYDSLNRQNSVVTPGGTATTTTFDSRGLPLTVSMGATVSLAPTPGRSWQNQNDPFDVTADGQVDILDLQAVIDYLTANGSGTLPEPPISPNLPPPYVDANGDGIINTNDSLTLINVLTNSGSIPAGDQVLVTSYEYDGNSSTGGKDGNLTKETQHVDSSSGNDRVTIYDHDWRNRRISVDGEIDLFVISEYDNLDRVVQTDRWNTSNSSSTNLIGRQKTFYDDLGRVYESKRYAVAVGTGVEGSALTDKTWHDAAGNVAKQQPAGSQAFTKTFYDGVGRVTKTFVGYDTAETTYAAALTVSGDTLFEQSETAYDKAGNTLLATTRRRFHDATGTGELTSPSGSQPKARVSYQAMWHDGLGRTVAAANYGTNGGTALTRPATVPSRSDTVLVSSTEFNARGEGFKTIDPAGRDDRMEFDDAGRQKKTIQNYDDGDPTTGAADKDVTVETTYNLGGQIRTIKARQQSTANDQVTTYWYGVRIGGGSTLNSNDLLAKVTYPDSADATDNVGYKYNRQGQVLEMRDQNGSVHAYDFDKLGRQTHDRVTTLASGVDGAVRRISTTYEVRGLVEKITSHDNATAGSGTVVNEVQNAYNDFGQLITQYQAHAGAVNTGTTPKIQYTYTDGTSNHIRPTKLTYPNGRILRYEYGSATADDNLSRISYLADDASGSIGTHLAEYSYLGLGMVAKVDYTEPDIRLDLAHGAGSDPYDGLDRFDRVQDLLWRNYGTSTDAVRIKHGYDRASNRLWREDPVAAASSKDFDELYTYDGIYQLKTFKRGNLNGTKDAIVGGSLTFEQNWGFDQLGNWSSFKEDAAGDGTFELDQTRTHNKVNEITGITGGSWVTPAHDRNGNMTTMPQPAAPTTGYASTYDAWNRLVKLVAGANIVAEYAYDGQKWRTVAKNYTGGTLSETRHFYYTEQWQANEERLGTSTNADRQFVWGLRYIDDLVLRDRDTSAPADGTLDERLYAMQDPNWNVTATANASGTVQERYAYDAYGKSFVLDGSFVIRSTSSHAWETRYAGYRSELLTWLHDVRHSQLHSVLGRWLQRDIDPLIASRPVAPGVTVYANNRSTVSIDPAGLVPLPLCTGDVVHWKDTRGRTGYKHKTTLQDPTYEITEGGCTTPFGGAPGVYDFNPACNKHDACYQTCNSGQEPCDRALYNDLLRICARIRSPNMRTDCRWHAWLYYRGLQVFGSYLYSQSQRDACLWVDCCIPVRRR